MNNLESFSNLNMDDLTFATWPYPYPNSLVPQSTHPDLTSTAGSYVPDFNADDVANLASRCVDTSTYETYPTVSQNILDPWFTQALCMFPSSAMTLRIHRMRIQSHRYKFCELTLAAATGWRPILDRGRSPCHRLGGCNT